MNIANKLTFKSHIDNLCRTAHFKLHALRRIRKYLSLEKAKVLGNSFIESQFNYGSLVWMFCRKNSYIKIQKLHLKTLRVIYQSNESYERLLEISNKLSIHQRHLRFLLVEIYKSASNVNPEFMWQYFISLVLPNAKTTYFGTNTSHFRGSLIWNYLLTVIKNSQSF